MIEAPPDELFLLAAPDPGAEGRFLEGFPELPGVRAVLVAKGEVPIAYCAHQDDSLVYASRCGLALDGLQPGEQVGAEQRQPPLMLLLGAPLGELRSC